MSTEEPSESKEPIKIERLTPDSREVNVIVKVISKSQVRDTTSGRDFSTHIVADALVGDETGCVYLTLWDDKIGKIDEGNTISIKNGYVKLLRGSMRLNIGRYGNIELLHDSPITEVNTKNNLSDKLYEQERPSRYGERRGYTDQYQRRRY